MHYSRMFSFFKKLAPTVAPVAKVAPVATVAPTATVAPVAPVAKVAPTATVAKVAPVATVAKVAPVATVAPITTVAPVAPALLPGERYDSTLRPICFGLPLKVHKDMAAKVGAENFKKYEYL
jgi:hypothetical protein